jgi:hypothetical protein
MLVCFMDVATEIGDMSMKREMLLVNRKRSGPLPWPMILSAPSRTASGPGTAPGAGEWSKIHNDLSALHFCSQHRGEIAADV